MFQFPSAIKKYNKNMIYKIIIKQRVKHNSKNTMITIKIEGVLYSYLAVHLTL
jgi:hypothetical protein